MPRLFAVHHLGLTVADVERSARWYEDVLGFTRVGEYESPAGGWRKVFLRHPGLAVRLGLVQHRVGRLERFDETVVGLDHLAFAVGGITELGEWVERLAAAGASFSPPAPAHTLPGVQVIVLRDPDNIQLELIGTPD